MLWVIIKKQNQIIYNNAKYIIYIYETVYIIYNETEYILCLYTAVSSLLLLSDKMSSELNIIIVMRFVVKWEKCINVNSVKLLIIYLIYCILLYWHYCYVNYILLLYICFNYTELF